MLTEVSWKNVIGKTLKFVRSSFNNQQCVLVFEDGTYTTLGIDRGHSVGEEAIVEEKLDWLYFGEKLIVDLGIMSQEEVDAENESRAAEFERKNLENLRCAFAVLKERLEKAEARVAKDRCK